MRRAATTARARRSAGFTFIELMVVITLIGLMSAVVVANLDGMTDRSSLSSAARKLGNMLLSVRDTAASQGRELIVEIDVDKQRWRTVDIPSPADVPDPRDRADMTYYGTWQQPPYGVVLDSLEFNRKDVDRKGLVTLSFDAEGQLSPSGFVAFFRHESLTEEEGVSVEMTGLTANLQYVQGRVRSEEVREPDDF